MRSSRTTCSSVDGGADHGIHDEQHGVGEIDRDLGLRGDGGVDALRIGLPAAGVDDRELAVLPLGLVVHPVAGDAGGVLHDGLATADDAVDERGLADVRAADDREHRQRRQVDDALVARVDALEDGDILVIELVVREAGAQRLRPAFGVASSMVAMRLGERGSSSGMSSSMSPRRHRPSRSPLYVVLVLTS